MGIEYTDHSSQEEEPLNQMAPLRNKHFGETSVELGLLNCEVTTLSNSTEYLGILAYFVHSVELNRTTERKSPKRAYKQYCNFSHEEENAKNCRTCPDLSTIDKSVRIHMSSIQCKTHNRKKFWKTITRSS